MQKPRKFPRSQSRRLSWSLAGAIVALALPGMAVGQVVDTNRPGFSFTPGVVADGRWQLETGIAYERPDSGSHSISLPQAEARFGLSDGVEIFLSSISWSDAEFGDGSARGLLDMAVGTKVALTEAYAKTRMAVLFQLSVPVGDGDFSSDRYDPSAAFIWTHDGRVPLAGTVKVSRFRNGFQLDNGLKLPFSLGGAHSAFVEWEANLPEGRSNDTHWLNGGYHWLLDDRTQLDANAGIGLNDRAGDYRLGAGFSILF
jgi:hypothetical protein